MIRPLTSLRFFFALIVFLSHLKFLHSHHMIKTLHLDWLMDGHLGVAFFFILSGFILTHSYHRRLPEGKITTGEFLVARFARIYPLHLLTLLLSVPYYLFARPLPADRWLPVLGAQLTLTQAFVPDHALFFSLNAPAWSLSAETFFYFLFPVLLPAFYGARQSHARLFFATAALALPLTMLVVKDHLAYWFYYINPAVRVADFALGMLLFGVYRRLASRLSGPAGCWFEAVSVAVFLLFISLRQSVPQNLRFSFYYWLPMCLVILSIACEKGWLARLLTHRVFVKAGEMSFAFYLIHLLVIQYAGWLNYRLHLTGNFFLLSAGMLIISLCAGYLLHRYVERPCNAWIRNLYRPGARSRPMRKATAHRPAPQLAGARTSSFL